MCKGDPDPMGPDYKRRGFKDHKIKNFYAEGAENSEQRRYLGNISRFSVF